VDPGIVLFMLRDLGLSPDEVDHTLNNESGLLGLSGVSNDMRDVEAGAAQGDPRCRLALDVYAYRVKKYIGAFAAAMGGLDTLVFTAGVGENDAAMRAAICDGLGFLGIDLDAAVNAATHRVEKDIAAPGSRVRVLVMPTDEEGMIADQTVAVVEAMSEGSSTP
jgi:acetate kinase